MHLVYYTYTINYYSDTLLLVNEFYDTKVAPCFGCDFLGVMNYFTAKKNRK